MLLHNDNFLSFSAKMLEFSLNSLCFLTDYIYIYLRKMNFATDINRGYCYMYIGPNKYKYTLLEIQKFEEDHAFDHFYFAELTTHHIS